MASGSTWTIEHLKTQFNPQTLGSPRKCNMVLKCAVLTKSALLEIRRGNMFSMILCDADPTSTIRAVCFDGNVFDLFTATKTYNLRGFKLKKGMGNDNDVEIIISGETKVAQSLLQFAIEKRSLKISQILGREISNVRFFNVKAKVISIEDAQTVGRFPDEKLKRDVILADESGQVTMVLWRQKAISVEFNEGDVVHIKNAVTSTFNNSVMVSTSGETKITVIDEEIHVEVSTSLASPSKKHCTVISVDTNVLAYKNFRCQYRCINCSKNIDWIDGTDGNPDVDNASVVVECPHCSTTFVERVAKVENECELMVSYDDRWYTTGDGVLQQMFQWDSAKRLPNQQDKVHLLKTTFTMRLDIKRRRIDHSCITNLEEEPSTTQKIEASTTEGIQQEMVVDHEFIGKKKVA